MKSSGLTFIKIIIGVLTVFAIVVTVYQLYKYNFVSIKTESAVMGELEETLNANGIFFRDESAVNKKGYDYLDVIRTEGERVAAKGTVARVYTDEHSAKVRKEIRQIEEKIATYEEVLKNSGSYESAVGSIDREIYDGLNGIAVLAEQGNGMLAFDNAENLVISIMKKKIASGDLVSYDTVLDDLRSEFAALKASGSDSVELIKAPKSGHFSLSTDGLEERLTPEYLSELSVENFEEALSLCANTSDSGDNIGKMVFDNSWSVAIKVPAESVSLLEVKDEIYINIPSFGSDKIKCTVADIRKSGEECVLILDSSVIMDNILTLRQEEVQLILKNHNGILVRQSALRKVDGDDGVFVKVGLLLRYKKVHILYNDGVNAIIEYVSTDESGLRIYDQVVYKGSNLYDGKAVS